MSNSGTNCLEHEERTTGCQQCPDENVGPVPESRTTRVVLELAPAGECFMDDLEGVIVDLETEFADGVCHCDVTVCNGDTKRRGDAGDDCEIVHVTGPVCGTCPGVVFSRYNCVPRMLSRTDDSFIIATYVPSVDVLSELVDELRDVCTRVTVRSLVDTDATDHVDAICEVDLTTLTEKQRRALNAAVALGYYDTPQSTSLTELATQFGISPSAFSQRLGRAESTVLSQVCLE